MKKSEMLNINKKSWDLITRNKVKVLNTTLPEYGPFCKNEEQLKLMNPKGKIILEIGCGEGDGASYLINKGAKKVVGIDISKERIKIASDKKIPNTEFFVQPMEKELDLYKNYFDYVILVYSIGYTSDLEKTLKNIYKYLKKGGKLIISWTHPFFECINLIESKLIVQSVYENKQREIKKGENINLIVNVNKLSYMINNLIMNNFKILKIIEENAMIDNVSNGKSNFYAKDKVDNIPGTIIYMAEKI